MDSWGHPGIYVVHLLYLWDKETDAWEGKGLLRPPVRVRSGTLDSRSKTLAAIESEQSNSSLYLGLGDRNLRIIHCIAFGGHFLSFYLFYK